MDALLTAVQASFLLIKTGRSGEGWIYWLHSVLIEGEANCHPNPKLYLFEHKEELEKDSKYGRFNLVHVTKRVFICLCVLCYLL